MADLISGITKLGNNLENFLGSSGALYVVYFFAFFFTIYVLLNTALQRGEKNPFIGKPGKVISLMLSFMITGAIFYGKSTEKLVTNFNSVGAFIFILFFAIAFIGLGSWLFKKNKDKNFDLAMFSLSFFSYVGGSLLWPHFLEKGTNNVGDSWFYFNDGAGSIIFGASGAVISDIIFWLVEISFILMIIFGIKWIFGFFFGSNEVPTFSSTAAKDKKSDEHKKRITDLRSLLNALITELKDANNHFNNKVNLLNDLRVEIAKLKASDKKGGKR